jgi:hypothetical protein
MSDTTHTPVVVPEPPPVDPTIVFPTISADDPQAQAQINAMVAQMNAQLEQQRNIILEQATARFQREMAEMQARQQIETYAQHATTPTFDRPHALPFTAQEMIDFLTPLSAAQRTQARAMFDRLLKSGFVDFGEYGAIGEERTQSAAERWDAAVAAKTRNGMARSKAIEALMVEQKALYEAYRKEGR